MVVVLYVHGSQQTWQFLCHSVPFEVESSRRWNVIVLCGSAIRKLCEDHQWCISEDEGAYFPPCFFWNVKGSSKVPNLLGNDLFKFSGDRCLPLGFEHISKSTFFRNLGLQTKNFATCVSVESLEKLWTSRVLDDVSTRNGLVNGCPGRSKGLLESTWPNLRWI